MRMIYYYYFLFLQLVISMVIKIYFILLLVKWYILLLLFLWFMIHVIIHNVFLINMMMMYQAWQFIQMVKLLHLDKLDMHQWVVLLCVVGIIVYFFFIFFLFFFCSSFFVCLLLVKFNILLLHKHVCVYTQILSLSIYVYSPCFLHVCSHFPPPLPLPSPSPSSSPSPSWSLGAYHLESSTIRRRRYRFWSIWFTWKI